MVVGAFCKFAAHIQGIVPDGEGVYGRIQSLVGECSPRRTDRVIAGNVVEVSNAVVGAFVKLPPT